MRLLVSFLRKSPMAGVSSSMPCAECRSRSALSRLRASSTHASGELAIEAAPVFDRPRLEFSYNMTEMTRLDIDRPALLSDSTTVKPFGGER